VSGTIFVYASPPGGYDRLRMAAESRHQPTASMLVRLLADGPQPRARLIEACGRPESAVAQALTTLKHRGIVARLQHGVWTLTEQGRAQVERADATT
jgi:predicted transcriptional regulator